MDFINMMYIILVSLVFGIIVWDINYNNKKGKIKMNRLKRRLIKLLRRWLGISGNLDTMLGLIIIDGRARIEALEKHKKDIHYAIDEQMRVTLKENNKQTIERFEAIERRVSKLELINVSCGIDNDNNNITLNNK